MINGEVTHEEKVEEIRIKIKTAYDRWMNAPADLKEACKEKWEERKRQLAALLNSKTQAQ